MGERGSRRRSRGPNRRGAARCDEACLFAKTVAERPAGIGAARDRSLRPRLRRDHLRSPPLQPALALPFRAGSPVAERSPLGPSSGSMTRTGARPRGVEGNRLHLGELDPARGGSTGGNGPRKSLTECSSYADVAAGYSGYTFWERPAVARTDAVIRRGRSDGRPVRAGVAAFTFADYVTDAWDEAINVSDFHPTLGREVEAALRTRGLAFRVQDCRALASLPRCQPLRESDLPRASARARPTGRTSSSSSP